MGQIAHCDYYYYFIIFPIDFICIVSTELLTSRIRDDDLPSMYWTSFLFLLSFLCFYFSIDFNGIEQTVTFSDQEIENCCIWEMDLAFGTSEFNECIVLPYKAEVSVAFLIVRDNDTCPISCVVKFLPI